MRCEGYGEFKGKCKGIMTVEHAGTLTLKHLCPRCAVLKNKQTFITIRNYQAEKRANRPDKL